VRPTALPVLRDGAAQARQAKSGLGQDASVLAMLNLYPYNVGHIMIATRRHTLPFRADDRGVARADGVARAGGDRAQARIQARTASTSG